MSRQNLAAEFSYLAEVLQLPPAGRTYKVEADEESRARVAERLGLKSVEQLKVEVRLRPISGGMISVDGTVTAEVVQTCVVSLVPIPAKVSDPFSLAFATEPLEKEALDDEEEILLSDDDMAEALVDGRIDIGEVAVEQLALALNPYPRAPGVEFNQAAWQDDPEPAETTNKNSPFAALAQLKKDPGA